MDPVTLTESASTGIDVVGSLTPLMTDSFGQVITMVKGFLPYIVGIALLGAGVGLIIKIVNSGRKAIG